MIIAAACGLTYFIQQQCFSLPLHLLRFFSFVFSLLGNNRTTIWPCGCLSSAHTHYLSICHSFFLLRCLSPVPSIDCDSLWDSVCVSVCLFPVTSLEPAAVLRASSFFRLFGSSHFRLFLSLPLGLHTESCAITQEAWNIQVPRSNTQCPQTARAVNF